MQVKTRPNDNDGLDVVFLGGTFEETVAIRNAFSTVDKNREYAQKFQGGIMDAIRANEALTEVHTRYKEEIRDRVEPTYGLDYEDENDLDEGDEFDDWD